MLGFVNILGAPPSHCSRSDKTATCNVRVGKEIPYKKPNTPFGDFGFFIDQELYMRKLFEDHTGDAVMCKVPALGEVIATRGLSYADLLLQDEVAVSRGSYPYMFRELLGENNISFRIGEDHASRRKLIAPVFTRNSVGEMVKLAGEHTAAAVESMVNGGGVVKVYDRVRRLTFENMLTCLIGVSDPAELAGLYEVFCRFLGGLFAVPVNLPGTPWSNALEAKQELYESLRKYILERQAILAQKSPDEEFPGDALTILMESKDEFGEGMSVEEILVDLVLIMFAGFDTTAANMTRITQVITDPKMDYILKNLQEEILPLRNEAPNMKAIMSLEYTNLFLMEIHRRFSTIPAVFRMPVKDVMIDGHQFQKGDLMLLSLVETNLDERVWPNALQFNPERFRNKPRDAIPRIPSFGGGQHMCLGKHFADLTLKLYIMNLIWATETHKITLVEEQDLRRGANTMNTPQSGCLVQIEERPYKVFDLVDQPSHTYSTV